LFVLVDGKNYEGTEGKEPLSERVNKDTQLQTWNDECMRIIVKTFSINDETGNVSNKCENKELKGEMNQSILIERHLKLHNARRGVDRV